MKMMIWDCGSYQSEVRGFATRGVGALTHDEPKNTPTSEQDAAVAFITIETKDDESAVKKAAFEITSAASDWSRTNVIICPFAHLSDQLAEMETAQRRIEDITQEVRKVSVLKVTKDHFGSHKSLSVDLVGHPGDVRFRSF